MKKKSISLDVTPSLESARKRNNQEIKYFRYDLSGELKDKYKGLTYYIETYGCQANERDTETMRGIIEEMGFVRGESELKSDLVILNTCAIRENAENKVFGEIGRLKHSKENNPNMILGISGCMPQEEVVVKKIKENYPYVDLVFGTHNIYNLAQNIDAAYSQKARIFDIESFVGDVCEGMPSIRDNVNKAFVHIMYGCNNFCTYCIVPYTRGQERSRKPEDIVNEVKDLVAHGYKEVTLLGQNVNRYGFDFEDGYMFADLLEDVAKTGIERVRFTTSNPNGFISKTVDVIAKYDNIMPHIHLPVQSGNTRVLKAMNRKYTRESYLALVKEIKEKIPNVSLTTDIIVGFPGETEEEFEDTLSLVEEVKFEGAYTFVFSPREGTPAAKMVDETPEEEKKQRLYRLNERVNHYYKEGNDRFVGQTLKCLVDGVSKYDDDVLCGYTENNKLVNFKGDKNMINKICKVKILEARTWFLLGEMVGED